MNLPEIIYQLLHTKYNKKFIHGGLVWRQLNADQTQAILKLYHLYVIR
jgi:hypothetical protein